MKIPKPLTDVIDSFRRLPGIGPKSAQRLSYYLLHVPQSQLDDFSLALSGLKKDTVLCSICKNVSESEPCELCRDSERDGSIVMVVEQPLDTIAFENTGSFNGLYHVMHGRISPLENIGPDEIFVSDLINRVKKDKKIKEVIIATNPNMEGEATALYVSKKLKEIENRKIKITRLGVGIPSGADLEYADDSTLTQALEGRKSV